jgi:FKBP-type peptidyl-prolyl cis-trans isomerase SlyD
MKVQKNYWVQLRYTLTDSQGQALEEPNETARYLHGGYGVMFEKLESALEGKSPGDNIVVYLEPAEHFGEYDADLVFIHPRSDLTDDVAEGDFLEGRPGLPDDGRTYRVLHLTKDTAVLDGNHPYSEIALRYELTIDSVTAATPEEIELQRAANEMDLHDDDDEPISTPMTGLLH